MKKRMGRPSIFTPKDWKDPETRRQGIMTKVGVVAFEKARVRLAKLVGWESTRVADGDVMEYLARGEAETKAYLAKQQRT